MTQVGVPFDFNMKTFVLHRTVWKLLLPFTIKDMAFNNVT